MGTVSVSGMERAVMLTVSTALDECHSQHSQLTPLPWGGRTAACVAYLALIAGTDLQTYQAKSIAMGVLYSVVSK